MLRNEVTSFVAGKIGGGANVGTSLETITKGDILILNAESGEVLTGGANTVDTAPVIAFASCIEDGTPIISGNVYGKSLVAGSREGYIAPVQKVSAIGYSATSTGSTIPAAGSEKLEFSGSIVFPTDLRLSPNKQNRLDFNAYSVGGYDLGGKIVTDVNYRGYPIKAYTTSNGAQTNIGTAATATVVEGGKTVTFSSAHGLSSGDYVFFPEGGLYIVSATPTTTTITLDYKYQGVSKVFPADTAKEVASPTNFGVAFVGQEIKRSNPVNEYNQANFSVGLGEAFGGLEEEVLTEYVRGKGTGWETRDKEVSCMGWLGYTDRLDTMRAEFPFSTSLSANYKTVSLSSNAPVRGDLQQEYIGPQASFLAFDSAADTQLTAVMAILTPWASSGGVDLS